MATTHTLADPVMGSLEQLEQCLRDEHQGREQQWSEGAARAMVELQRSLEVHVSMTESADGQFSKVDLTRPTLVRQVSELRQSHAELIQQVAGLLQRLQGAAKTFQTARVGHTSPFPEPARPTGIPHFGDLRQEVEHLLETLHRHLDQEAGALLESVNTDLGAGD